MAAVIFSKGLDKFQYSSANGLTLAMFLLVRWFELFVALWFGSVVLTHFEEVGALAVMLRPLAVGVALEAIIIAIERIVQIRHRLVPTPFREHYQ
jgi:hypothetical protein